MTHLNEGPLQAMPARLGLLCALLLPLGSCVGRDIETIREIEPAGSEFSRVLAGEYRRFALFEADEMYDWNDAALFARKGLRAARGELVEAERLEDWRLPRESLSELGEARATLVAALEAGARSAAPAAAARAQASFDCWIEQQEENHQPEDIEACRGKFYSLFNEIIASLEPKPEIQPVAEPDAEPAAARVVSETPLIPFEVILFAFDSHALDSSGTMAADRVAAEAAGLPETRVVVIGHADRSGGAIYNMELSVRRARAVGKALIARGVERGQIESSGRVR